MSHTMTLFSRLQIVLADLADVIEEEAPGSGAELLAEDGEAITRELRLLLLTAEEKGALE